VLEQGYNTHRTGANLRETALTAANVHPAAFGRLYGAPMDGHVHAQPLFVGGAINGRDALYVACGDLKAEKQAGPSVIYGEPVRSIFTRIMRNNRDPLADIFDAPQWR
jgi:hypothetical protein